VRRFSQTCHHFGGWVGILPTYNLCDKSQLFDQALSIGEVPNTEEANCVWKRTISSVGGRVSFWFLRKCVQVMGAHMVGEHRIKSKNKE
jgi:hypothetical protein